MSKTVIACSPVDAMGTSVAFAGPSYDDYARVTQVTPEVPARERSAPGMLFGSWPEHQSHRGNSLAEPSSAGWPAVCSARRSAAQRASGSIRNRSRCRRCSRRPARLARGSR